MPRAIPNDPSALRAAHAAGGGKARSGRARRTKDRGKGQAVRPWGEDDDEIEEDEEADDETEAFVLEERYPSPDFSQRTRTTIATIDPLVTACFGFTCIPFCLSLHLRPS